MAATQKCDTAEQGLKHEHMDLMQLVSFHVGGENSDWTFCECKRLSGSNN